MSQTPSTDLVDVVEQKDAELTAAKEVAPPKEGVSDAVKQAYVEDQKEKSK